MAGLTIDNIVDMFDCNFCPGDLVKPLITNLGHAKNGTSGIVIAVDDIYVLVAWSFGDGMKFQKVNMWNLLKVASDPVA